MASLRASERGLEIVNSARVRRGWSKSSDAWANLAEVSSGTLKRFWQRKAIRNYSFQEICSAVGIHDWKEIADFESLGEKQIKPDVDAHFITGNPVLYPRFFFGRTMTLERIFDTLKRHPLQNIAILGKKRSGKTSLLHYISKITKTSLEELRVNQGNGWLNEPEEYNWIFIDFQDKRMMNQEKLLSHMLSKMGLKYENPLNLETFMEVVSLNLRKPTVILFDEIDIAIQPSSPLGEALWESLCSLGTNQSNGNLAFVIASSKPPSDLARHRGYASSFFNIFGRVVKIGPLTATEAYELIDSSPIPFCKEDKDWIIQESQCWPLLLQILCSQRLFSLEKNPKSQTDENYAWKAHGLMEIENFRHLLDTEVNDYSHLRANTVHPDDNK